MDPENGLGDHSGDRAHALTTTTTQRESEADERTSTDSTTRARRAATDLVRLGIDLGLVRELVVIGVFD